MKLCVLVPSQDYLEQAGVRIRYRRIAASLLQRGTELSLRIIDDVRLPELGDHDVYLFSKIADARAITLAHDLNAAGRLIGADLFDDYFSQHDDSRFIVQRQWLRTIAPLLDFFLCSTSRMADVLRQEVPLAPVIQMNDPFAQFDEAALANAIEHKLLQARDERIIRVAWFGMGDNPHFDVGLHDLAGFGSALRRLEARAFRVELEVMTNRRALTATGFEQLRRLGVQYSVSEWSEAAEADLLDRSLVAFIPVNSQAFSIAKSLNRAVTAFSHGAQILSPGYPLYQALERFVYDEPERLLQSIEHGSLLVRRQTLGSLGLLLDQMANPGTEAANLVQALKALQENSKVVKRKGPLVVVLHGVKTTATAHKLAQRLQHLSVATPFSTQSLKFDIRFSANPTTMTLDAAVSERAYRRLSPEIAQRMKLNDDTDRPYTVAFKFDPLTMRQLLAIDTGPSARLAAYSSIIAACEAATMLLFPKCKTVVSELQSPLHRATTVRAAAFAEPARRVVVIANGVANYPVKKLANTLNILAGENILHVSEMHEPSVRKKDTNDVETRTFAQCKKQLETFKPEVLLFLCENSHFAKNIASYADLKAIPIICYLQQDLMAFRSNGIAGSRPTAAESTSIKSIRTLLSAAKLIVCATPTLKARMIEHGFSEETIRVGTTSAATIRRIPIRSKIIRIGYAGDAADLALVAPAIREILERHPAVECEFLGISNIPDPLKEMVDRIALGPLPTADQDVVDIVASRKWDVGLCPSVSTPDKAVRTSARWVDYSAAGAAVIASRGTVFDQYCTDGCGLLAADNVQWTTAIELLINDAKTWREQVTRAQERLLLEYSEAKVLQQVTDSINMVLPLPNMLDNLPVTVAKSKENLANVGAASALPA